MKKSNVPFLFLVIACAVGLLTASLVAALEPQADIDRQDVSRNSQTQEKTETAVPGHAPQDVGGPDSFGYTYADSDEASCTTTFNDISGINPGLSLADDGETNVILPFDFTFYGVDSSDLRVGNNGALIFGATTGEIAAGNVALQVDSGGFGAGIMPFWDDLDTETGDVYTATVGVSPTRQYIVQWHQRPHFNGIDDATLQVVLYEDSGNIDFVYSDTLFADTEFDYGASATIGIQQDPDDGSSFLQYSFDTPTLTTTTAICFTAPPPAPILNDSTKTGPALSFLGDPITYTITITNSGDVTATGAMMTDTIPVGTTYIASSVSCDTGSCTYNGGLDAVTFTGNIAPGGSAIVTFAVMPGSSCGTSVSNSATISAPGAPAVVTVQHDTTVWQNIVYWNDLELDNGGFITDSVSEWEWGTPTFPAGISAFSGVNVWGTDLDSDAADGVGNHILTGTFTVPQFSSAVFSWWDWYGDEAADERQLWINGTEVWNDSGGTDQQFWALQSLPLDQAYSGQTIDVAFNLEVCCAEPGPEGWYLDNIALFTCDPPNVGIEIEKTVGLDPASCGTDTEIYTLIGEEVVYCYSATNVGGTDLITHTLQDNELGTILSGFNYVLTPTASVWVTASAALTQTTVNTATWWAYADMSTVVSDTASATVNVVTPASYPVCATFESGTLPSYMFPETTSDGTANGRVQVTTAFPLNGSYNLDIDTDCDGCGGNTRQAAIMAVDLDGVTGVELNFWVFEHGDENNPEDGVFISDDGGVTWALIQTLNDFPAQYVNVIIPLEAAAASAGMSLVDGFLIKFQSLDNFSQTSDGYSFDDICVQEGSPGISVSPTSLDSTQFPDEIMTDTLTISNIGATVLTWSIDEEPSQAKIAPVVIGPPAPDNMHLGRNLAAITPQATQLKNNIRSPQGLIPDGSFEQGPPPDSNWTEVSDNLCEWIGDWSGPWGVAAFDGSMDYWAGGLCGTPAIPSTDSVSQTINIPTVDPILRFWYIAFRPDPDDATVDDYAYINVNGTEVWRLDMIQANDTFPNWVSATVDLSVYAGQSVVLTLGGVGTGDGATNSTGNVRFDFLEIGPPACGSPDDVPWLSTSPSSGSTASASSTDVDVVFDSAGLMPDTYTANLCLSSNDPNNALIPIPVTLDVISTPPEIAVSPDEITADLISGQMVTATLTISNSGMSDLIWGIGELANSSKAPAIDAAQAKVDYETALANTPVYQPDSRTFDCMAYENYYKAEPEGYAENCLVQTHVPEQYNSFRAPTDTGFAHDLRFDNVVEFTLNDFPGQTVLSQNTEAIFGYDFSPDATILYALNDGTKEFGTFAPATGTFMPIGPSTPQVVTDTWTGLAVDPISGTVYAISTNGSNTELYTIDPATGAPTFVGNVSGVPLGIAIAMNTAGELYLHDIDSDAIYQIDPASGAPTFIGATGFNANFAQGMDFDNDDGTLYIFLYIGGGANVYGTVDLATGAVTPLAQDDPQGEFEGAIPTLPGAADCEDDLSWLYTSPMSGTVPGNSSVDVTVMMDATGLDAGTYGASLCVESNDMDERQIFVPVTMTVGITANVQIVHLAPFASGDAAVDIYLDGMLVVTDLVYAESTGYLTVPGGAHMAEVMPAGTSTVAMSGTFTLTHGSDNTIMAVGGANGHALSMMHLVDNVAPTMTVRGPVGYVRIGHLAPFAMTLDDTAVNVINDADDSVILSDVKFGDVTGYLALPVGEYDLRIELASDNSVLFDLMPVTVAEGAFIAAYAGGDGVNQTPDVYAALGAAGLLPSLVIEDVTYTIYAPVIFKND